MGENTKNTKKVNLSEAALKSKDYVISPREAELEEMIGKYQEQIQAMYNKMVELQRGEIFARLNYLFKITDNADKFTSYGYSEIVNKSFEEIEDLMFGEDEVTEDTKED